MSAGVTTPDGAAQKSRAGRDLPASIAVAIVLIAIIVASLAFVKDALPRRGRRRDRHRPVGARPRARRPTAPGCRPSRWSSGAVGMIVGAYYGGPDVLVVVLAGTVLVSILWRMPRGQDGFVRDVTATVFCLVYLPFLASFVALLLDADDGVERVLTFIVVTIASDIGGFVAGVLFGEHPMAPVISPKKTWEGFAGSAVGCVARRASRASSGCSTATGGSASCSALVVVVAATLGDLAESLIKRDLGHQGHEQHPARPRRHHGPARLAARDGLGGLARPALPRLDLTASQRAMSDPPLRRSGLTRIGALSLGLIEQSVRRPTMDAVSAGTDIATPTHTPVTRATHKPPTATRSLPGIAYTDPRAVRAGAGRGLRAGLDPRRSRLRAGRARAVRHGQRRPRARRRRPRTRRRAAGDVERLPAPGLDDPRGHRRRPVR